MLYLIHDFISFSAERTPDAEALVAGENRLDYASLQQQVETVAGALLSQGLQRRDRVAIYLNKQTENVLGMFGTSMAGGVFVPVNPVLKATQVSHILHDCSARILITSAERLKSLASVIEGLPDLELVVLVGKAPAEPPDIRCVSWDEFLNGTGAVRRQVIDTDVASILYTSGSTGKPKGVVLSHRNMFAGAQSVASYLNNVAEDRLLAALPFSFDVGFSQLSTAFWSGATVVLHDYFFASDVVKIIERERINALTGVPPFWMQIADQQWPESVGKQLRYFANTGGKMPRSLLQRLRTHFPKAEPYLMYGLTEAFRSTFLPPGEVDRRPDSIGKAIPNAEILVVRPDGSECDAGEPGELVHRGALVSLGYWNSPEKTLERFKPAPKSGENDTHEELAVWSGDIVKRDEEGFLYFVGRKDGMIKTSGYRVSPTEIEEAAFASGCVSEAAAFGADDERLGQRIVLVATPGDTNRDPDDDGLLKYMKRNLPAYMLPAQIKWRDSLPRNPNGKIDRTALQAELDGESGGHA